MRQWLRYVESEPELSAVLMTQGMKEALMGWRVDVEIMIVIVMLEDNDGGPAPGGTDNEEEEARWTDHLSNFPIPDFTAASGLNFNLPDIPNPLDYFVEFVGDDLWDLIVVETNRYVGQKLSNSPERLANFVPVTRTEFKAFIGINIIVGIAKLPQVGSYWSLDDFFGNQGIKVMTYLRLRDCKMQLQRLATMCER